MEVRDHELDRFGVVNNAVYQNYLEHARHAFLASRGISLTHLLEEKFRPVITRIDPVSYTHLTLPTSVGV